jgi:hypothetical protein
VPACWGEADDHPLLGGGYEWCAVGALVKLGWYGRPRYTKGWKPSTVSWDPL